GRRRCTSWRTLRWTNAVRLEDVRQVGRQRRDENARRAPRGYRERVRVEQAPSRRRARHPLLPPVAAAPAAGAAAGPAGGAERAARGVLGGGGGWGGPRPAGAPATTSCPP